MEFGYKELMHAKMIVEAFLFIVGIILTNCWGGWPQTVGEWCAFIIGGLMIVIGAWFDIETTAELGEIFDI